MRVRFLLGPAGSGKTFRCLAEIRRELIQSPDGPALILLAPRQSTYELERQILSDPEVPGFTRLQILSFERLAYYALDMLRAPVPNLLDEEGRLMVLRGLLARHRDDLKLFRASARLTGFAEQLSVSLREFQRHGLQPNTLIELSDKVGDAGGLRLKLHDLGTIFNLYNAWLEKHQLQDSDSLLSIAAKALISSGPINLSVSPKIAAMAPQVKSRSRVPRSAVQDDLFDSAVSGEPRSGAETSLLVSALWVDGFGELDPEEVELLTAIIPRCGNSTLTFCVDAERSKSDSWLSSWSLPNRSYEECRQQFAELPGVEIETETLRRDIAVSRFSKSAELRHLESHWDDPVAFPEADNPATAPAVRLIDCDNPDAEAIFAAREILKHVRNGGRYRDIALLVRSLDPYSHALQRAFSKYEIPFFLDRREVVSHHPLAELTRNALRTIAFNWEPEDWFAALKSGLVPASEDELDWLENVALARGWRGDVWFTPIVISTNEVWTRRVQRLQGQILPCFQALASALGGPTAKITGPELATGLRQFWQALRVEEQLQKWADAEPRKNKRLDSAESVHTSVWTQMTNWLANLELGFPNEKLRLREWLPILEAGFGGLTVGMIPPALDQVLIGPSDRSRNPDIRIAILLGMNEGVFPAPRATAGLLSEDDRTELLRHEVKISGTLRQHVARERYYGYIAFTRQRERLLLVRSIANSDGQPLNPSPFLSTFQNLFPALIAEYAGSGAKPGEILHASDLVVPLLQRRDGGSVSEPNDTSQVAPSAQKPLERLAANSHSSGPIRKRASTRSSRGCRRR